jgi:hypothetical protein
MSNCPLSLHERLSFLLPIVTKGNLNTIGEFYRLWAKASLDPENGSPRTRLKKQNTQKTIS